MVVLGHDTSRPTQRPPRWRRVSLAVEPAPALYSSSWRCLTGSRVLLASAPPTAVPQGGTAATPPPKEHPSLNMDEVCAVPGQKTRFSRSGDIEIFDTPPRKDVRTTLTAYLITDDDQPAYVVLTGMGGTGKSHNLAYWVKEQRDAGHLVVYVNDMENWIRGGDQYIFREIEFGLYKWRGWKANDEAFRGFGSAAELQAYLDEAARNGEPPLPGGPIKLSMADLQSPDDLWTTTAVKAMIKTCTDLAARVGKKCIFVVDQDNKLHKIFTLKYSPEEVRDASTIDKVIKTNNAHVTIASASANNEGWERRGWSDVVVQPAHEMEPCDADAMIRMTLAPHDLYSDEISKQVQEVTGRCPLDIKIICDKIVSEKVAGSPQYVENAMRSWRDALDNSFKYYALKLRDRELASFTAAVVSCTMQPVFDRQFMEYRRVGLAPKTHEDQIPGTLTFKYRNPYIGSAILAYATTNVPMSSLGSSAQYERSCLVALPCLLKPKNLSAVPIRCITTVFPYCEELMRTVGPSGEAVDFDKLAIFSCVPNGMYIDALSIEIQDLNPGRLCIVNLFQMTQNQQNHVDSYSQVKRSSELKHFIRAVRGIYDGYNIEFDIRFIWMVPEGGKFKLNIANAELKLTKVSEEELKGRIWFMLDEKNGNISPLVKVVPREQGAQVTRRQHTSRNTVVKYPDMKGDVGKMKEYVYVFDNRTYPMPEVIGSAK